MTFQVPNLRLILWAVTTAALLAVIALAPTPVSLSGVAMARTPAPTNSAGPTPPPTAVASFSNVATLHKVHIGGDGFSIINPGPGEEASGNIAFDKDNEATVELDSYLTSSSICAWPTQPQASVAIDREDSLPGITFDQSLHSSKGCASPVDFDVQTGSNDVTITVTAPDGVTIIRYLITFVVPERPAAPAPETWAQDPVTRGHTFITPYTNEALATGFTSANGSADRFWIASIRVEEELARLARVVVSLYDRETGEVDRGAGFDIGPCNGVPSTFKICEYGSFANPELWYGNGILWLTVEKYDSGHGNRHYLYAFQQTASSWKLLSDKTIRLTHYDHISAGRDNSPGGIWSDGETMWVTGHHLRAYAYNMATGERDRSEEFSVPGTTGKPPFLPYSVGSPAGLWSNGKTMWVEGAKRRIVYAFDLQTKARVPSRDYDIVRSPPPPSPYDLFKMITSGMWSDGSIIWVRQGLFNVAYDLPGTPPQFAALYAVEMASDSSDVPNLITVVAADADNDSITYAKAGDWPARFGIDSTSGVISYTRGIGASVTPGEYELTVTADDGIDETAETTVVVSVSGNSGICDRTPQVRDGILALLPNVSDCELVTAEDLAGITGSLLLINKGITGLKSGDFQGLANLQELHLERNSLTALPADVFNGLASLNKLHLEHNSLTALPTDMFTRLPALKLLHLRENEFTALPADTFADAAGLERLILDNNHLLSLPEGVFDGLSKLKSLDLHHNKNADESKALSALPDGVLDDLVELEALLLHDNALTTLPGFERLGKLEELRLQDNALATLPEDAFNGLGKLEDLSLENNKLTALPTDVFAGLVKLKDLSLENNNLRTLPAGAFAGLSSLESLYLYGNKLNALPGDVFEGLGALRVLALFDNKLRDLPDGLFEGLSSLNTVWFIANTGAPFTLTPVLKQDRSSYEIAVRVAQGAPADMTIALSVSNGGVLSQYTATIEAGSLASEGATLSRSGTFSRVFTVSVDSAAFVGAGRDATGRERIDGFEIGQANPLSANLAPGQRGEEEEPTESGPAAVIALSPPTVPVGAPIDVTMTFSNLESDSNTSDTDYIFRADVVGADQCEDRAGGYGLGVDRYMYKVDEDPEVRRGTISADCPAGAYTVRASISSPDNVELASATAGFTVNAPDQQLPEPASSDATLNGLTLSGVNIGTFASATTGYTASVANDVTQTTVTPTTNDGGASYVIKLDGAADEDGTVSLAVGSNAIAVKVTAEDGNTTRTYTVTVTRAAPSLSADATLRNLALSGIDFGAFDQATTGYTASVASDVRQTTVSPTTNDGGATYAIKLDGVADADGVIPLAVGTNVITVEVTAEDGSADKTYKVTVSRAALTVSGPAVAIALSPSGPVDEGVEVTVTMSFANLESDSDTSDTDYIFRADVRNADGCVGGGMGNDRYMYKVDEDPEVRTGTISTSCASGDYTVEVSISSPGNVKLASATAGFTVNAPDQLQPEPASTDATLSGLTLSDVTLAFASDTTRYTVNVASDMDETTVTPTTNDGGASYVIKLDGVADEDGVIPLGVGGNVITVEVTAEDGNGTKTYTVSVTRAAPPLSTDAALSGLTLSGVDIGAFDPATTEYAASVANDVDETTVTPSVNDDGAVYAVKLDGVADADGTVPLSVGGNVFTVEVTAEDGNTAKTYTVTVTRAALPPAVAPDSPGAPTGSLDGAGNASLDWNDVGTATGYEVGLWWNGEWTTLPNEGAGLGVSISGSGATVTGLPTHWTVYYFRIRAVYEAGTSDWSPMSKLEL